MKKNISILKNCYGCGICVKSCGKKIIELRINSEGFYEPYITNETKCNECGLCLEVCAYNYNDICLSASPLKSYASWSKNKETREKCSSGGVGFEISRALINKGYKVCAVRYNTKSNRAEHYIAESINDLMPSRGSKYIQSYTPEAFKKINRSDKYLITGTPCQIDSFRRYIQKFQLEDNFVLMDFFCHGVPSMLAWNKYRQDVEKYTGNIIDVEWRNKDTGWHDSWCMNIKGDAKTYMSKATKGDYFYQFFLGNACLNKACYSKCKYKNRSSSADIRVGDLWGNYYKNNEEGISALIIFTQKGNEVANLLQNTELIEHPFEVVAEDQMKHKLKEPKIARDVTLSLLKSKFFPVKIIIIIMKVCLKLFK